MNKNHIDILIAGSSELVSKYQSRAARLEEGEEQEFYYALGRHYIKIYKRAIAKSRLDKDT